MSDRANPLSIDKALPDVSLRGPDGPSHGSSLWVLDTDCIRFGLQYVEDARRRPAGVLEDDIFPARVLAAAAEGSWWRPTLVDLHLMRDRNKQDEQKLSLYPREDKDFKLTLTAAALLGMVDQGTASPDAGSQPAQACSHVVARPMTLQRTPWKADNKNHFAVPPFQLVHGRVGLRFDAAKARREPLWRYLVDACGLRIDNGEATLWLTPEGLEFDANVPVPGLPPAATRAREAAAPETLAARVALRPWLLTGHPPPANAKGLALSFLRPLSADREAWARYWQALMPPEESAQTLPGLRLRSTLAAAALPDFHWSVSEDQEPPASLLLPARALRVEALSPDTRGQGLAAAAVLETGWIDVRWQDRGEGRLRIAFPAGEDAGASIARSTVQTGHAATGGSVWMADGVGLSIDGRELAVALREACAWPTPRTTANASDEPDPERPPLLSAFVPLVDGWLQVPVPNQPPVDPENDAALTAPPTTAKPPNRIDGFLTWRNPGSRRADDASTPWELSLLRAEQVAGIIIRTLVDDRQRPLTEARLGYGGVALSARGLVRVSSDRPDALEALPRLGRGPGAFIDVLMQTSSSTTAPTSALQAQLHSFSATWRPGTPDPDRLELGPDLRIHLRFALQSGAWKGLDSAANRKALRRDWDSAFGVKDQPRHLPWPAVLWRRHPHLPMIAAVPMTRTVASATRPLESRDLMPFMLDRPAVGDVIAMAALRPDGRAGLFHFETGDDPPPRRLSGWPWGPATGAAIERGVAFAALDIIGSEWRPDAAQGFEAALTMGQPLRAEACAMATLPPVPPVDGASQPGRAAVPEEAATALRWTTMTDLFGRRERQLQNARVIESHLRPFHAVGKVPWSGQVTSLVRGLTWQARITIDPGNGPADPFARLTIAPGHGAVPAESFASPDETLKGLSRGFGITNGTTLSMLAGNPGATLQPNIVDVLGFSPASYVTTAGGITLDNRSVGAGDLDRAGALVQRPVVLPNVAAAKQVSADAPLPFEIAADLPQTPPQPPAPQPLAFWFKDVLFMGNVAVLPGAAASLQPDAWDDDTRLLATGLEWRLYSRAAGPIANGLHPHVFDFFGFKLEPLRLTSLTRDESGLVGATVVCRLGLGSSASDDTADDPTITITFDRHAGRLRANFTEQALRFRVRATEARHGVSRSVTVTAQLGAGTSFRVSGVALQVLIAGVATTLGDASMHLDDGALRFEASSAAALPAGRCVLRLSRIALTVPANGASALVMQRRLVIDAASEPQGSGRSISWSESTDATPVELHIFGLKMTPPPALELVEGDGCVGLRMPTAEVELAEHGGLAGTLDLALLVRPLPAAANARHGELALGRGIARLRFRQRGTVGEANLQHVHCSGLRLGAVLRSQPGAAAGSPWQGSVEVHGLIATPNAIQWPALDFDAGSTEIPVPKQAKDGRARVQRSAATAWATHRVGWLFDGHVLPAGTVSSWTTAASVAWSTLVAARHELMRGGKTLSWNSIDSISIGPLDSVVPPLGEDTPRDKPEPKTFAPRDRRVVKDGAYAALQPGMNEHNGAGDIRTVLQGCLGRAFRQARDAARWPSLVVSGGFLGTLELGGQRLLRLPLLASLKLATAQPDIRQTAIPLAGTRDARWAELAWADGPAARLLAAAPSAGEGIAKRHAAADGASATVPDAAFESIRAALIAGSERLLGKDHKPVDFGALTAGWLAEQSFARDMPGAITLETGAFFVASAVGVECCLRAAPEGAAPTPQATSLVSAWFSRQLNTRVATLGVPARATPLKQPPERRVATTLDVLGANLSTAAAESLSAGAGERPSVAAVMVLAERADARPAMMLIEGTGGFTLVPAPQRLKRAAAPAAAVRLFADAGRGPSRAPPNDLHMTTATVLEGPVHAVRDDARSGIAGLARRLALPGSTAVATPIANGPPTLAATALRWINEHVVPPYLPLLTAGMVGPPIRSWQSAARDARLPVGPGIEKALKEVDPGFIDLHLHALLPGSMTAVAIGERPGEWMVRRTSLLQADPAFTRADANVDRFGQPAVPGSSFPVTIRTPRPGPLPANDPATPEVNRRTQANELHRDRPLAVWLGSADGLQLRLDGAAALGLTPDDASGEASVAFTFVTLGNGADPSSADGLAGTLDTDWDGRLVLACRLDARLASEARKAVVLSALSRCIAPVRPNPPADGPAVVNTRARLSVGTERFEFRTLTVDLGAEAPAPAPGRDPVGAPVAAAADVDADADTDERPLVHLTLSLWAAHSGSPEEAAAVKARLHQALTGSRIAPDVAVELVLVPSAAGQAAADEQAAQPVPAEPPFVLTPRQPYELTRSGGQDPWQHGDTDLPVTLRFPLYLMRSWASYAALSPATVLFEDPAYNRELSGPPVSVAQPQVRARGVPTARGELLAVVSAERSQVGVGGAVVFLADLRMERPMGVEAQRVAERAGSTAGAVPGGDLIRNTQLRPRFELKIEQIRVGQPPMALWVRDIPIADRLLLGDLYELPLSSLVARGSDRAAELRAGDVLRLAITAMHGTPQLFNSDTMSSANPLSITPGAASFSFPSLDIVIVAEGAVSPPVAAYSILLNRALDRAETGDAQAPTRQRGVILHAQSPLPSRIDVTDAARGMRTGLLKRRGTFRWPLARPRDELLDRQALAIVKTDVNGQTHVPPLGEYQPAQEGDGG